MNILEFQKYVLSTLYYFLEDEVKYSAYSDPL